MTVNTSPNAQCGRPIDRSLIQEIVRKVAMEHFAQYGYQGCPALMVHASARHVHLSREHLDLLFGPGYELTQFRPLYQPGAFAATEVVTIIGPRSRLISNLRILGPLRQHSQVELASSDAVMLGFGHIPIRLSGDIAGSPGAVLMGPCGVVELKEGVIRAATHVHMNPEDAANFGVRQGDFMKLRVGGAAGLVFNRVCVRIDPLSKLDVHMDTDEGNACGLHLAKDFELFK